MVRNALCHSHCGTLTVHAPTPLWMHGHTCILSLVKGCTSIKQARITYGFWQCSFSRCTTQCVVHMEHKRARSSGMESGHICDVQKGRSQLESSPSCALLPCRRAQHVPFSCVTVSCPGGNQAGNNHTTPGCLPPSINTPSQHAQTQFSVYSNNHNWSDTTWHL